MNYLNAVIIKPVFLLLLTLVHLSDLRAQNKLSQYVNPMIGTGGHGHTFPGAVMPFGMVQLSPDTRVDGSWDGCSGYHYSDSIIYGFSHTHLSGTGCTDWGDILLMPALTATSTINKEYSSKFSHSTEKASPGYYEVKLKKNNIKAELTVTPRVGIHRYTFPKSKQACVVIDLLHRDKTLLCNLFVLDSVTLTGERISEAWAKEQHVYFVIKFSEPFKKQSVFSKGKKQNDFVKNKGMLESGIFNFDLSDGQPLLVKVALSFASTDGAINNLKTEATHWDFERYHREAEQAWEEQLNKIVVQSNDEDKKSVFYTALYHCSIHPSLNMDADGTYRGRDNKLHKADGFTNYSVFSLWDTYRALHPLFTIIERKRSVDFINSFLHQYKQSGRLPVWELSSNETDCMIGFHSVSVIADAMAKGIKGFDSLAVYTAMKAASNYSAYSIPTFNSQGFLQVDDESESVSKSLEYAYDNWCVAQAARYMGQPAEERLYLKRSLAYKHLFDKGSGHMRPRKNGGWLQPFYPNEINNHFTEGNSWQYSFYVPHDIKGLIALHGGAAAFETKLDELFQTSEKTRGREQADVTGLIGQYAHGNEPSHHMTYLYNYVGKPQKTIQRVRQICTDFYKNSPDGLIGNEDCGQMSAWYVMSALGFYAVCPGSPQYVLGQPIFNTTEINLENGKRFTITANPDNALPVNGILLNGQRKNTSYINHSDLINGQSLVFISEEPAGAKNNYGLADEDCPSSEVKGVNVIATPIIHAASQVFADTLRVNIETINNQVPLLNFYTLNNSNPEVSSTIFNKSFLVDSSCVLKARTCSNEDKSSVSLAKFYKLKYKYAITIKSQLNAQYAADGGQSLMDGISGDVNWRKGNWLGCQGQDFECVVDFKKTTVINRLALECLQDSQSWIILPTAVKYFGSNDGVNYVPLAIAVNTVSAQDKTVQLKSFEVKLKASYRYVKVVAKNFGILPAWHLGAGGEAFIFADELIME